MKLFAPNIGTKGRLFRAACALLLLAGAAFAYGRANWLCALLAAAGLFSAFEAARGWCALRACGVKTKY